MSSFFKWSVSVDCVQFPGWRLHISSQTAELILSLFIVIFMSHLVSWPMYPHEQTQSSAVEGALFVAMAWEDSLEVYNTNTFFKI